MGCNFCRWVAAQSVFYHLYNQVSYMSLDQISPLTFSIGNTMKRISVIVSSIIIFHTPIQPNNALGAAIAILGTFLYSQVHSLSFYFVFLFSITIHYFLCSFILYIHVRARVSTIKLYLSIHVTHLICLFLFNYFHRPNSNV